jgi:hypothetical protein
VVHEDIGGAGDELFGYWLGGGKKRPHPEPEAEVLVRAAERVAGRDDVEDGETGDDAWVVQRHPVGAACTTVMSDHGELVVSQGVHDLDLLAGDGAHAVRRMIRRARRCAAIAEAPKVGGDHGELLGELGRDAMPHQVCLGDAVQQENWWTLTAPTSVNRRSRRANIERSETVKHRGPLARG